MAAGKSSTLILHVDLSCCKCNKKIKKLLCKIQDRENIRAIAYDEEKNTVTISGPFDSGCLERTLYCKACKIITKISIPPPPPSPPRPVQKPSPPPTLPSPPPKCGCKLPGPVCCTQPCYVGMYGGMKCASCGMVYTWSNQCSPTVLVSTQPLLPQPYYGYSCGCGCGQPKTSCNFIYEDDTSQCTIM